MGGYGDNYREWNKLERLRYLLDHWNDIFDARVTSTWATFTGTSHQAPASSRPSPLPRMADDLSVRRIERALIVLADREPVLARHLKAYRCNAEWRTTDKWVVRRLPSGKRDIVEMRVREKLVPDWVELRYVTLAEMILVNLLDGPIEIPQDLWHALDKP